MTMFQQSFYPILGFYYYQKPIPMSKVLMKQLLDLFVRSYTDQEYVRDANF